MMMEQKTEVALPDIQKDNLPKATRSAVLNKVFDISLEQTPLPAMKPTDVLVKVVAVGICGSDVHYYDTGHIGDFVVKKPLILGHESSGIVVATGDDVQNLKRGDRVAIEPGVPCGHCSYCRSGRYNLCPNMQFMATPPVNGDLSELIVYPQDFLFPIPDNMSYEIATLNEPFSVSIHASQLLGIKPGSSVFISGGGPVGLLAILAARTFGAHQIIVSDTQDLRLQTAKKMGADRVINALEEDPRKVIAEMTNGEGVDFVLEASGNPKAEQAALRTLKRGGKLAYIGVPTTDAVPLDIPFMTDHETQVFGIFRYANTYPLGLEILEKHMDLAEHLLTDFYPLSQTKDALEKTRTDKGESLKVVIYPNEQLRHN